MNSDSGMVHGAQYVRAAKAEFESEERKRAKREGRLPRDASAVFIPVDPARLSASARAQLARTGRTQISRNSRCPCGSGKRFKRCHMTKAS